MVAPMATAIDAAGQPHRHRRRQGEAALLARRRARAAAGRRRARPVDGGVLRLLPGDVVPAGIAAPPGVRHPLEAGDGPRPVRPGTARRRLDRARPLPRLPLPPPRRHGHLAERALVHPSRRGDRPGLRGRRRGARPRAGRAPPAPPGSTGPNGSTAPSPWPDRSGSSAPGRTRALADLLSIR